MAINKEVFKTEKCKVLLYDRNLKTLDIDFNRFGIRIDNVDDCGLDYVSVKYKGEIGSPYFTYKLT